MNIPLQSRLETRDASHTGKKKIPSADYGWAIQGRRGRKGKYITNYQQDTFISG